jgi:hypothetical protein
MANIIGNNNYINLFHIFIIKYINNKNKKSKMFFYKYI